MCPLNPSRCVLSPRYAEELEVIASNESDESDTIYCQIATGYVHIVTDAASCIFCYFNLASDEKSQWITIAKHLLIIGELPTGIVCSICNLNRITATRDPSIHCFKCQLAYLKHLDGRETCYIDSDGNTVVTIFHMVDCHDYRLYADYLH